MPKPGGRRTGRVVERYDGDSGRIKMDPAGRRAPRFAALCRQNLRNLVSRASGRKKMSPARPFLAILGLRLMRFLGAFLAIDISDVQSYDLGQAQSRPEG